MARWFANNVGLIGLSFVLAFFVWALASLQQDPIVENTLSAPVVVVTQPTNGEIISTNTLPPTVTIRLRAPLSVFETLDNTGIQVPVNLSQLGVGEHVVTLEPVMNTSPSMLLSTRPTTAVVVIEQAARQTFPVKVTLIGTPAIGYSALAPNVEPAEVTITGTQAIVSQVVSVDAIVSVDNVRSSVDQIVRLVARDGQENVINGLSIRPEVAQVRVPMEQLSNYRDLAVRVKITGQPENGYAVTNVDYTPQVVTVVGPREAMQQLPGFIETFDVSIEDAKQDVEQRVGLNVPPNVSLVSENQSVSVRVRIEPQQGARTVSRRIEIVGVTRPLTATVSPPSIDIVLVGPLPLLNTLRENDVRVQADATNLPVGAHQIAPAIITPEGITVQSVLPSTVQIDVQDERDQP
jgi:YbbR domain-containing protein